jgi:undecaprenyl-diphosphatase
VFAVTGLVFLAVFVALMRMDWAETTPSWDVSIASWVHSWTMPGLLPIMIGVSWPGWAPQSWLIVLAVCTFLFLRGLRLAVPLALAAATSHLVVSAVKNSVHRVRPDLAVLPDNPLDPSFPSGHTTTYTIFLGLLVYLAWRQLRPGWVRSLSLSSCFLMIALVGPSRVYLGQHWPSDVLAGYLLGGGLLLCIIAACERWGWNPGKSDTVPSKEGT